MFISEQKQGIADDVRCQMIEGMSLRECAAFHDIPSSRLRSWLDRFPATPANVKACEDARTRNAGRVS